MLYDVSPENPLPLTAQIAASVRAAVASGALKPGDPVPSTRAAAAQAGVSRGTVVTAYDQLASEGYLLASQGAPTRVHPQLRVAAPGGGVPVARSVGGVDKQKQKPDPLSLQPTAGALGAISPAAWRRAWREASADPAQPGTSFDPAGELELRAAIAEHLRLARGVSVDPARVLVTGGSREGLLLILMALGQGLRAGVEDPGHPGLRRVIPLAGHEVVGCGTDALGVTVGELGGDLDALLVTPAHLFPLGGSMPASRRAELIEWAAANETVIIEDDFNAELRYRISPQPPLAQLGGGAEVITLGTFSTLLSKELAAGYVVTPEASVDALRRVRAVLGMPVSAVTQRAIAQLLRGGAVRRATRAAHATLARRRRVVEAQVVPALAALPGAQVRLSAPSGIEVQVLFDAPEQLSSFTAALSRAGLEAGAIDPLRDERRGAVLSFAHLTDTEFSLVMARLLRLSGGVADGGL